MRHSQIMVSLIQLLFATFMMACGGFCLGAAYSESFKEMLAEYLSSSPFWLNVGLIMCASSLILMISFYYLYRRQSYRILMGGHPTDVSASAIEDLVTVELQKLYPSEKMSCEVDVQVKNKQPMIEIKTTLPLHHLADYETMLGEVENKLEALFINQFGYRQEFVLNVSFK